MLPIETVEPISVNQWLSHGLSRVQRAHGSTGASVAVLGERGILDTLIHVPGHLPGS